jgi:hypothetical protein
MGDGDKYEDTDEGKALYDGLQLAEIEHRNQLLKQHSHLENIGLPRNAFFHDICYYLNDLKKIGETNGVWNSVGLLELDSLMPLLTITPEGKVSHISAAKWASGVWFGEDKLTRGTKVATGGYGTVYRGTLNGKSIALKIPLQTSVPTPSKIVNMYAENIIHAELFCYLRTLNYMKQRASIPKPIFFTKYFFQAGYRRVLGMEELMGSLSQWMQRLWTSDRAEQLFIQMLKSLALLLHTLQKHYQFGHRDFHASNIMYKATDGDTPSFRWYVIDFGLATMVLDGHRINANEIGPYDAMSSAEDFTNKGHDMRTLILSLKMADIRKAIPPGPTLVWIEQLRDKLLAGLDEHSIRLDLERTHFHRAYNEAFSILQSPETEPEAILKDIETLERHRASTRLQTKARQRSARKKTTRRRAASRPQKSRSRSRSRTRSSSKTASKSAPRTSSRSKSKSKSKSKPKSKSKSKSASASSSEA